MDARSDPSPLRNLRPTRSLLENAELRGVLTNLSHELCRPLVSLRAGFDLILGNAAPPIPPDQRGHLQTMLVLCDDLLRLTRSYLDYASIVQGARPLHNGSYTLSALVREIDHEFATVASARRIQWECMLEGEDAKIVTDASRCQQIFGNLASNALKFTPQCGRVRVKVRHEGAEWRVVVSDSGPGIPPEAHSRVFEPFYRLSREERAGIEGNGLGLAICRELVEQMGGEISLGSELGEGTRVTVTLPLEQRQASPLVSNGADLDHSHA